MNPVFQRFMSRATQLAQNGEFHAVTATIEATLAKAGLIDSGSADNALLRFANHSTASHDASVVDGEACEVSDAPSRPSPSPRQGRFIAGSHSEAGLTREYKLYLPPGEHDQPLPLVVMLHGCTQDPDDFAAGTRMNEAAQEQGFFVLYPAQAQTANASRCWNWFKHNHQARGRGEPAVLAGMTRAVIQRHAIDPQRVYVAGLSAGGAMAAILGDAYPDLFAAVGVHSGLPAGAARDLESAFAAMKGGGTGGTGGAPPTIVFHGDQDVTVHPANGKRVAAASAGAASAELERSRSAGGRLYTRAVYRGSGGQPVAEHWSVHGAGHAWSGGSPRGSYTDAKGPDATQEMLRFFFTHTLIDASRTA
jgi:poly(hydroxyalkanoate) depolymerase family esterase